MSHEQTRTTEDLLPQINQALLAAFPTDNVLAQMVRFGLKENLSHIAQGENLQEVVFELITWAEAQGRLTELVIAASQFNPGNAHLKSLAAQFGQASGVSALVQTERELQPGSPFDGSNAVSTLPSIQPESIPARNNLWPDAARMRWGVTGLAVGIILGFGGGRFVSPKPEAGRSGASVSHTASVSSGELPAGMEVKTAGGEGIYRVLSAKLEPFNTEKRMLRFLIRYTNNSPYNQSFTSASFRLKIDGIPRAPINSLVELVDSRSAQEGEVQFEVPAATRSVVLLIGESDKDATELPIDLSAAKP